MIATNRRSAALRHAMAALLAASMLAGCASAGGGGKLASAGKSATQSQKALAKGDVSKAVSLAEAAVAASPRDPELRAMLAQTYLQAGRFRSAVTTFDDAMELGDSSPRNALGLALSLIADNQQSEAIGVLEDWRDEIPAADLGLALALAGDSARGVALMSDALRRGDNTPKLRQNLAYAYALDGRWKDARLMAAQDLAPDAVDVRITEWAQSATPDARQQRVATLLGVPLREDAGQPQALALATTPDPVQLAVEAAKLVPTEEAKPEALVLAADPLPARVSPPPFIKVDVAPAPVAVAIPAVDPIAEFASVLPPVAPLSVPAALSPPKKAVEAQPDSAAARMLFAKPQPAKDVPASASVTNGTHLVQLGSFSSEEGARRAWKIYTARNPALKPYTMTIIPAVVRGKNYWRVAASGFAPSAARSMCGSIKRSGAGCFAYATPKSVLPLPGGREVGSVQRARRR